VRILIAEDDPLSRRLLEANLQRGGHEVVTTCDGVEALQVLSAPSGPKLAVLDWMMPNVDGVEVCRRVRERQAEIGYVYVILLTARTQKQDLVAGFEAGADDYLTKPFDPHELRSRLLVGERILGLQAALGEKVRELESALVHVKQLQGLLPICMHCKKIRDDDVWHRLETYLEQRTDARLTHSLCGECLAKHYPEFEKKIAARRREQQRP
jgi:CheY-like chemotaxis protein